LWKSVRLDEITGLLQMRNRYYSVELGRFLTRDPLGVWGDGMNLGNEVGYAGNRVLTFSDALGLQTEIVTSRMFQEMTGIAADMASQAPADQAGRQAVHDRFAEAVLASLKGHGVKPYLGSGIPVPGQPGKKTAPDGYGDIDGDLFVRWKNSLWVESKCSASTWSLTSSSGQLQKQIDVMSTRTAGTLHLVMTGDACISPDVVAYAKTKGVRLLVSTLLRRPAADGGYEVSVSYPMPLTPGKDSMGRTISESAPILAVSAIIQALVDQGVPSMGSWHAP
jgi:RHS repeat-associated protein